MPLKFGDPESIQLRDKARHDATMHTCATCNGLGFIEVEMRCREKDHCKVSYRHTDEVDCPCCDGEGELSNEKEVAQ